MLDKIISNENSLSTLNYNQLVTVIGKVEGCLFWYKKGTGWYSTLFIAQAKRIAKQAKKIIKQHRYQIELSNEGSEMVRSHTLYSSLSYYDRSLMKKGFEHVPGGDNYVCYFKNEFKKEIVGYCEGDITHYHCYDADTFHSELESINKFIFED